MQRYRALGIWQETTPDPKGKWVKYTDAEAYAEEKAKDRAREVVEYLEAGGELKNCRYVFDIRSRGEKESAAKCPACGVAHLYYECSNYSAKIESRALKHISLASCFNPQAVRHLLNGMVDTLNAMQKDRA